MKIVTNTDSRVHVLFVSEGTDLVLKPGANLLSPAQAAIWAEQTANPSVALKHHLDEGTFTEKDFEQAEKPADVESEDLIKVVSETLDVDVLEAMQKTETRPEVRLVIDAQLAKLGPTPEQKAKIDEQKKRDAQARKDAAKAGAGK